MESAVNIGLICDEVVPRIPEGHTHLLISVRSKQYAILYRLSDGMYQGEISDKMALFGENPNKRESRLFCSYGHGLKFVLGLSGDGANVYEYDYDSAHQIVIPGESFDLAVNGGVDLRKAGRKHN